MSEPRRPRLRIAKSTDDSRFDTSPRREALSTEAMRQVYDIWQAADGEGVLPHQRLINPTALPPSCLPHISIMEVSHDPLRFRSRLVGTAVVEAIGVDHTGKYADEIDGMTEQLERFAWCVRERKPYAAGSPLTFADRSYKRYQVLVLPFGDDDGIVTRLLFVFDFEQAAKQAG